MSTQEKVISVILDVVNGIEIDASRGDAARPFPDLDIDSLDVAGIFLGIQENLGVSVPDDEIDALDTVEKIVTYLDARSD